MRVESMCERLYFYTVRIETTSTDGKRGMGTGFGVERDDGHLYIVTNRHVVENWKIGTIFFIPCDSNDANRGQPILGTTIPIQLDDFASRWFFHPTEDLAILPIKEIEHEFKKLRVMPFQHFIGKELIATEETYKEFDAVEDIVFVGYPDGLYDRVNQTPIVRHGKTATPPQLNYSGLPRFLIDGSVFRGSSGSPVLYCKNGGFDSKRKTNFVGERASLFGIITAVHTSDKQNSRGPQTEQFLDLGVVIKATAIRELMALHWQATTNKYTILVEPPLSI